MRGFKVGLVLFVLVLIASTIALAQTQPTQPEELVTVPKSMLTKDQAEQLKVQDLQKKVEMYGKWVGLGEELGKAVDGALKAITSNAVELSKTGLGQFTMFLVAYKVIGTDIVQLFIGLLFFVVGIPIFIWSYYKSCIPHRVLISDGPEKGQKRWEVVKPEDYSQFVHAILFFIFIFIDILVIFL